MSLLAQMDQRLESKHPALFFAQNFHLTDKGQPLTFEDRPALYEYYKDESQHIVTKKCVQCGVSEKDNAEMFARAHMGWSIIASLPTEAIRNTFVANRVDKVIKMVPFYREGVKTATGDANQVGLKHLWTGSIKFVGSNSDVSFLEYPADMLVIDEKDKSDLKVLEKAPDRLDNSPHKFIREVANPTYPDIGIDAAYNKSDKKEWHVSCETCGTEQSFDWFKNVVLEESEGEFKLRDIEWHEGLDRDIYVSCVKCHGPLQRFGPGDWIPQNPGTKISGYHFNQIFANPNVSIRDLWAQFLEALTNPSKMEVFMNSKMGLTYVAPGGGLDEFILEKKCMQDYLMPGSGKDCTAGIDVGTHYNIIICDDSGRTVHIGKYKSTTDVIRVLKQYGVIFCVIDAYPETREVGRIQDKFPDVVYLCQYVEDRADLWAVDEKKKIIKIDRTQSIDIMVSNVLTGKVLLPKDFKHIDINHKGESEYIAQMSAPKRIKIEDPDKIKPVKYKWKEGGKPDHYFHAHNYESIARMVKKEIGDLMPHLTVG